VSGSFFYFPVRGRKWSEGEKGGGKIQNFEFFIAKVEQSGVNLS
jgi:hypothetical protein